MRLLVIARSWASVARSLCYSWAICHVNPRRKFQIVIIVNICSKYCSLYKVELVVDIFHFKSIFLWKTANWGFQPPFRGVRDNARPLLMARWKARMRLPIRHNWTFFASSYCWDVTAYRRESVDVSDFWKGGRSLWSPILGGRGRRPPTTVGWQKTRRIKIALSCHVV